MEVLVAGELHNNNELPAILFLNHHFAITQQVISDIYLHSTLSDPSHSSSDGTSSEGSKNILLKVHPGAVDNVYKDSLFFNIAVPAINGDLTLTPTSPSHPADVAFDPPSVTVREGEIISGPATPINPHRPHHAVSLSMSRR